MELLLVHLDAVGLGEHLATHVTAEGPLLWRGLGDGRTGQDKRGEILKGKDRTGRQGSRKKRLGGIKKRCNLRGFRTG